MNIKLTGQEAIEFTREFGGCEPGLHKYADPIDGAESNIDIDRAEEVCREDASLIYRFVDDADPDVAAILAKIRS